jgi:pSer/pThr/pTyr-binding forkhead associated (FHA) protein
MDPPPEQRLEPGPARAAPVAAAQAPEPETETTRYVDAPSVSGGIVAVLAAVEGPLSGQVFGIGEGESLIGRSKECQVVTDSEWISRRQTKIVHAEGQFVIGPLSERNPTFLNDHPTEGSELKDGDFIRLGRTTFRFRTL